MQTAIAENSRMALDQNEYERRYANITKRHNTIKSKYDKISEKIECKNAQRELFKRFHSCIGKAGYFDRRIRWGILKQPCAGSSENVRNDIRFISKNGFEIKAR